MDSPGTTAGKARYALAAGGCVVATLLGMPLYGVLDPASIMLFYVLAVALSAARWGRGPAILASLLAVAGFNYFFVPPRFSFSVEDAQYGVTLVCLLAVSLLIAWLGNAYRQKAVEAERRARESVLLSELARILAGALTYEHVAELFKAWLRDCYGCEGNLFVAGRDERLHVVGDPAHAINIVEQTAAQGVYAGGEGTGAVADLHEDASAILLPLNGATRRRGVLAIYVGEQEGPEREARLAIGALVVTAIERIHYVQVAQASELEAQSVRLRSSILSAISHDIRTPLTVLYGLAETLASGDGLPPAQRETAVLLGEHAMRLHRMVDNLLDMARLKSGRVVLRRDWQSAPEIAAASARSIPSVLAGRRLEFDWPADMPLLRLDALLMERVFCNLLENAAKYSPPGTPITLGASVGDGTVSLCIANQGEGFPPERLQHVFDMFERGRTESAIPGVGIGLSICRAIVEAHGGSIAAANIPGGAEVRVVLPLERSPEVPSEQETAHG